VLRELRIENLLLIERAELRLGEGLNAITGETGAGKTILAHSLDLLMGGKARAQIVRPGADEAWVEGVFDLPAGLLEEPELIEIAARLPEGAEEIVLGRRVSASGRTAAFVAGRAASAADLKLLGGRLLAFYGQHEHRKLTIASAQMEVLDGFAGADHLELRRSYRDAHREYMRLEAELDELRERDGSRERDLDLLRFELSEIEEVAPDPAEAEALGAERERLRHAEGLREATIAAHAGAAGADEDGAGRQPPSPRRNRHCRESQGSIRTSMRSPHGPAPSRSSWETWRASCAPTWTGSRPTPAGCRRSRSGWTPSTA
jgi:DNA repair protein RecN (Recombination protein N)